MEFRNCDSNADKVKLCESVRKGLAEIYEDEPEAFGPVSMSENPYKDLDDVNEIDLREHQVKVKTEKEQIKRGYSRAQERIKNLRQKFSDAVTTGRRNGSGQITLDYYDEFVYADNFSDNTSSSSSNSLSNNTPYNYCHSCTSTLTKRKISINRNEEYLDTDQ